LINNIRTTNLLTQITHELHVVEEMETKNVNPKTRYICGDMIGQG